MTHHFLEPNKILTLKEHLERLQALAETAFYKSSLVHAHEKEQYSTWFKAPLDVNAIELGPTLLILLEIVRRQQEKLDELEKKIENKGGVE